jgi:hypothetical protein
VTLTDPMSVTQFEVGQTIEASATDGGAALGTPGLRGRRRPRGQQGDLLDHAGRRGRHSRLLDRHHVLPGPGRPEPLDQRPGGLPADHGSHRRRLLQRRRPLARLRPASPASAGTARTQSIEEALVDAAALAAREDGNPELAITNHTTFAALEKALGAKREYVNYEHDEVPGIGFSGLRIHGADEEINIFADRSCPGKLVYGLDPDSWTLGSMKALPHILTELDGLSELRDPNNDATQIRIGGYGILANDAPGHNFVAQTQS